MRISGSVAVPHPVEAVWDALLSPEVLVRSIPGCSRLETVGEHSYAMTVTAGVAAIKGTYDGTAALSDLVPHESLVMRLDGAGAPGTIGATVAVSVRAVDGGTEVSYDADAVVGGMVGGVGQRMLTSVSKRMAAEFFGRLGDAISGEPAGRAASASERIGTRIGTTGSPTTGSPPAGQVFTAPQRQDDRFLPGVAVGAGLVLLGVVAGRWLGRGSR